MTLVPHRFESSIPIDEAIFFLNSGHPVAIPTETVYGLASRIDLKDSLNRIFKIKARPFFDPLIVHVSTVHQAIQLCSQWTDLAQALAEAFWPGPITFVLEKSERIDQVITSGLSTVGLRMPNHPDALALISACGPLAAPSANKFGRTSPTQAQHILQEYQGAIPVVDGGPCQVGIESTILKITDHNLSILRLGQISQAQIDLKIKEMGYHCAWVTTQKEISPGTLKHHYMPSAPLIVHAHPMSEAKIKDYYFAALNTLPDQIEGVTLLKPSIVRTTFTIALPEAPDLAARNLYGTLRSAPADANLILLHWPDSKRQGDWIPIWDRLRRAATLII